MHAGRVRPYAITGGRTLGRILDGLRELSP
jgi:hypothetical protein